MSIPYVYFIKNKTTGLKYIGVKYAKNSDPNLFWVNYFTSSKRVCELIEIFGKDDFKYKILKTFNDPYSALVYENKLNRIAFRREDYLNCHYNFIGDDMNEADWLAQVEKNKKSVSLLCKIRMAVYGTTFPTVTPEQKKEFSSLGGVAAGKINKILKRAIFDPEVRKRQHKTLKKKQISAFYDPNTRKEISSAGGRVGMFSKAYYEKNGLSEEQRIEAQRERGRRGGPGNKGFIWYTDDVNSYKYTTKQQNEMSFDDFLKNNPQFRPGRFVNYIIYTDGIKNYSFYKDSGSFDDFLKNNPQFRRGETKSNAKKKVANDLNKVEINEN